MQHGAHEFLVALIDMVEKELKEDREPENGALALLSNEFFRTVVRLAGLPVKDAGVAGYVVFPPCFIMNVS